MPRLLQGTTCPRCQRPVYLRRDGRLGEHKSEYRVPFSNRRERCIYSGSTPADAAARIPPLRRETNDRLRARHTAGEALTLSECAWLDRLGIAETSADGPSRCPTLSED